MTLLHFPGCPNWQTADANLRTALNDVGMGDVEVHRQIVDTTEGAERLKFLGSPTVLIDGCDPFAAPGAAPGLSCRVYPTEAELAAAPSDARLRGALTVHLLHADPSHR